MAQSRRRDRNRKQDQLRAQLIRQQRQTDFDDLDDEETWSTRTMPSGAAPRMEDLDNDEMDGDDQLEEEPPGEEAEESCPPSQGRVALRDVIGSRTGILLIRLVRKGDRLEAELLPSALAGMDDSLEELRLFVQSRFDQGPEVLQQEGWLSLLDSRTALTERLRLLARLAIRGNIQVEAGEVRFEPNDRGLERYSGKFAALPDGVPFSLRLLLEDGQGRARVDASGERSFNQLPYAIQLQALHTVLFEESRTRRAQTDSRIADRLLDVLERMGINLDRRTTLLEKHVIDLRRKLVYHEVASSFPNRIERQKRYDEMSAETAP